jgi:hypothetical protein
VEGDEGRWWWSWSWDDRDVLRRLVDRAWVLVVVVAEEVAVAVALAGSAAAEAANDPSESNNCRFRPRPDIWRWRWALGGVEFLVRVLCEFEFCWLGVWLGGGLQPGQRVRVE